MGALAGWGWDRNLEGCLEPFAARFPARRPRTLLVDSRSFCPHPGALSAGLSD